MIRVLVTAVLDSLVATANELPSPDRIVALMKGQVVKSSTHDRLMAIDGGVSAGLVNAQAVSQRSGRNDGADILIDKLRHKDPRLLTFSF